MKNQNTDDIKLKPGETITDETLDELTSGKEIGRASCRERV